MATQGPPLEEVLKLTTPIPLKEDVLQMARDARRDQGKSFKKYLQFHSLWLIIKV